MNKNGTFQPDWASAPGETIADILKERNLPHAEFARRIGQSISEIHGLLEGHSPITNELAKKLEQVLGASAAFWVNREAQYRQDMGRQRKRQSAIARGDWLKELP